MVARMHAQEAAVTVGASDSNGQIGQAGSVALKWVQSKYLSSLDIFNKSPFHLAAQNRLAMNLLVGYYSDKRIHVDANLD